MADTEKVTVNLNLVDLGKIDLLTEEGFYSNRTDFIKTAVRNQLAQHSFEISASITRKAAVVGMIKYTKLDLERILLENKLLEVTVIGVLVISQDVPVELAKRVFKKVKVFGTLLANEDVKALLSN